MCGRLGTAPQHRKGKKGHYMIHIHILVQIFPSSLEMLSLYTQMVFDCIVRANLPTHH